jgi:dephospho-CoA kinase
MEKKKKLRIAVTGNIGSGKTAFTKFLADEGYPVIPADALSKEILVGDPDVRKEVVKEFGLQAFQGNKINKKYLAQEIFSNKNKLKKINSILHPRVRKKIDSLSDEYFKTSDIVFAEAALIFESKIEKTYDYVVLITADKDIRMKRSMKSKKLSEAEFAERENNQLTEDVKRQKADFVFINDGSLKELKEKALLLVNLFKALLY